MSLALSPLSSNVLISESREALKLGRLVSARARLAVVESLLPSFTDHDGPPTISDASRAATVSISAQETTPGHKPLLGNAFLSLTIEGASSSKIDASQPCTKQSWKWRRRREAAMRRSREIAVRMEVLMVRNALGHSNELGVTKSSGARFPFPSFIGQPRLRVLAKPASMSDPLLYIRSRNKKHCACPIV
ncbi:hypothetical protein Ccrd_000414 [Cynara cardunculus var. scolymus]|uniref:Uncharacterized protein n=1 Tax=Cynara cardunculus var. scolymus TaxID=59895 RepID=A0A103XV57_CYNCS|nr:hypothetical protein Ccrd_000414 [Cynara cardunculus var. scolymus]